MKKICQRSEIKNEYKWDIEDMYADASQWEKDLQLAKTYAEEYAGYQGRLTENSRTLLSAMQLNDRLWMTIERVYVYAHMKKDEDNRVEESQSMNDRAEAAIAGISALTSFATPEILAADEKLLLGYIDEEPELELYRFYIMDLLRKKEHILSDPEENILAQMSEITNGPDSIFTMLNNADLKFGSIQDENDEESELTHGSYINFMMSHDRRVRKDAYEKMYSSYRGMINTIATTYNFSARTDVIGARIRKYASAREAALSSDNIPLSVYDNLVKTVNDNLPVLHRYIDIRKEMLGCSDMKMYDIYVPLIELPPRKIPYEEALDMIREGLAPLGADYISRMNAGLDSGWIDVYENEGKTSGAYSFGSYDSKPYILTNYTDTLQDVFTIVHEMGHSMHSLYTRENQPFIYGSHSIFTAETASTVNENLLMKHLIASESDPTMKKFLLDMHIEAFRTTLFRQTMFAEFEQHTHEVIENGEALTASSMCEYYDELNKKYYGSSIGDDDWIKYEWARIPHFYSAFYVYKYATGYSAATAISDMILNDGPERYLDFLKTGSSDYPVELLKNAGVDMSRPEPVEQAMAVFAGIVDEFEKLV